MDQIHRELLEKTTQDKINLKAAPQSPAIQKQEGKQQETRCQEKQAGDDETCMQVRTCMIQFACNKDMISLPAKNEFQLVRKEEEKVDTVINFTCNWQLKMIKGHK